MTGRSRSILLASIAWIVIVTLCFIQFENRFKADVPREDNSNTLRLFIPVEDKPEELSTGLSTMTTTVPTKSPKILILVAYHRGGSTFTASIFDAYPNSFYIYEPFFGMNIGDTLRFFNDSVVNVTENNTGLLRREMLQHLLACDLTKIHTGLFYTVPRFMHHPSFMMFHECLLTGLEQLHSYIVESIKTNGTSYTVNDEKYVKEMNVSKTKKLHTVDEGFFKESTLRSKKVSNKASERMKELEVRCVQPVQSKCRNAKLRTYKFIRLRIEQTEKMMPKFPTLKVIHLIRDPRGNVMSQVKGLRAWDRLKWYANDYCKKVDIDMVATININKKFPNRVHTIQYENISRNALQETQKAFDFMNLPLVPEVETYLNKVTQGETKGNNKTNDCVVGGKSQYVYCVHMANADSIANHWKENITKTQLEDIQNTCRDTMKKLWLKPLAFDEIRNATKVLSNSSKILILVAYHRGGSTFTASIFDAYPNSFYIYEPFFGMNMGDTLRFFNGTVLKVTGNNTDLLRRDMLQDLLACDLTKIHTGLFYTVPRFMHHPSFMMFHECILTGLKQLHSDIIESIKTNGTSYTVSDEKYMKEMNVSKTKKLHTVDERFFTETTLRSKKVSDKLRKVIKELEVRCVEPVKSKCRNAKLRTYKFIRLRIEQTEKMMPKFPTLKVIHLIRDPRGNVMSQVKGLRAWDRLKWYANDYCKKVDIDMVATININKKFPNRVHTIQYENISRNALQETQRAFDFMNLPLVPEVKTYLNKVTQGETKGNNKTNDCVVGGKSQYVYCVHMANADSIANHWKENITKTQLEDIQNTCRDTMKKLWLKPLAFDEVRNATKVPSNSSKILILVAYHRGGSTFTASIFDAYPKSFYIYEPFFGMNMGDTLRFFNGTVLKVTGNNTGLLRRAILQHLLACDLTKIHTGLFYSVPRFMHHPSFMMFHECLLTGLKQLHSDIVESIKTNGTSYTVSDEKYVKEMNVSETKKLHTVDERFFKESTLRSKKVSDKLRKVIKELEVRCIEPVQSKCRNAKLRTYKFIRLRIEQTEKMMPKFPTLKVIHLIRDPRGNVMSQVKGLRAWDRLKWYANDYCKKVDIDMVATININKKFPNRVHTIQYENISRNSLQETQRAFDFMNLPLVPEVKTYLNKVTQGETKGNNKTNDCVVGGKSQYVYCVHMANADSIANHWKENITKTQLEDIQDTCRDTMKKLWLKPLAFDEIRNATKVHSNSSKILILVAYHRGGSTFTASIFDAYPNSFYIYEPFFGMNMGDTLRFFNGNVLKVTGNNTGLLRRDMLQDLLACDLTKIHTGLFYTVPRFMHHPSFMMFHECLLTGLKQLHSDIVESIKTNGTSYTVNDEKYVKEMNVSKTKKLHTVDERFFKESTLRSKKVSDKLRKVIKELEVRCIEPVKSKCRNAKLRTYKFIRLRIEQTEKMMPKFPTLKVIHLIRDPRGNVMSQVKGLRAWDRLKWYANDYCKKVDIDMGATININKKFPNRVHTIQYENISRNALQETQKAFDFMNLPLVPEVKTYLNKVTQGETKGNNKTNDCVVGGKSQYVYCVHMANADSIANHWKENITKTQLEDIQDTCRDTMKKLWLKPLAFNEMQHATKPTR